MLAFDVERIARRPNRPDQVGEVAGIERLAEAADVNVNRSDVDVRVMAPDRVEEPLARENAARVFEEMPEKPEFRGSERDRLPASADAMGGYIHLDVGIR